MGDENQTFLNQRRGQSPEQFPLVSGRAHSAASNLKKRKISKSDDVKNEVELVDEEEEEDSEEELRANNLMLRGISDWLRDTDNENVEHVSGLNQCKRCGPAITEFLSSLLTPMRQELSCFESSSMAPQTMLHHIIYAGSGWWSWHELCNYEQTAARRAREREACRDACKVWYSASNATKEHVVWHEMLFRHLLVWVHWELREHKGERVLIICFLHRVSEPIAALLAAFLSEEDAKRVDVVLLDSARGLTADRVHVTYSSRFVGRYDQFLGIQADPSRLYVAYTRGRLATTVWMEREPLGFPDEQRRGDHKIYWMPELSNHPAKSASSRTTQQWIQFAARRLALLHRGEVAEPCWVGA